jgi:hypothetical protein
VNRLGAVLFFAALLAGCTWLDAMTKRQVPDTRIVLEPRQRMEFSRVSRRNSAGQHIDEYRCHEDHVMVCEGNVSFECQCWRKGL